MSTVWFELSVEVPPAQSDAVANFLIEAGAPGLQLQDDGGMVRLVAHYTQAPPTAALRAFCASLGVPLSGDAFRIETIRSEDWAENWKLHFRPQIFGRRLCVCPPWDAAVVPERVAVVIEPGMAFGTGQHASTAGCLTLLDRVIGIRPMRRALDMGTGSGILAIAMVKLGVGDVWAVDVDPQALAIAETNATRNGVRKHIRFVSRIDSINETFDLITANLYANPLQELAGSFAARLAAGGMVICAGLLTTEEHQVRRAYEACGLEVGSRLEDAGWVTLAFARGAP